MGCSDLAKLNADQLREKIRGFTFVRVAGEDPASYGLKVRVNGEVAIVTDPAATAFAVDEIIWRDIQPEGKNTYSFEALNQDGTYYPGKMTLKESENKLEIQVEGPNRSAAQTWQPSGAELVSEVPATLVTSISQPTTWQNTSLPVDYVVPKGKVLEVRAALTIEPGTVIAFQEEAGLGILAGGSLEAIGTAGSPISFEGVQSVPGFWRGIHIESESEIHTLSHVVIQDAGGTYVF